MGIPLLGLEQLHQLVQKIFHFTPLKPTFLFYTLIFTKHPHQFIYSTHLYNKIFILLQFFIIFFASLSLTAISLSQTQQNPKSPTLGHHQQPNHTHHQRDQPPSSTHQPPLSSNQPPSSTNQLPSLSNQPPQLHHHQPIQPNIINLPDHIDPHTRNPIQPKRNLNARNPIQPKQKPNQPHSTQNPLIKQPEIKESN